MTLTYVVEEVMPIKYSPPIVHPIGGAFALLDDAIAAARAHVPTHDEYNGDTYARITVEGWQA